MQKQHKGFTLIELLVVIAVIGLLASIVLVAMNSARQKARDVKRKGDIHQLKTALELYFDDNDFYPSIGDDNVGYNVSGLSTPLAPYLASIPVDPSDIFYFFVRGPVENYSYGILVWIEQDDAYCKTGVNVNNAWWV